MGGDSFWSSEDASLIHNCEQNNVGTSPHPRITLSNSDLDLDFRQRATQHVRNQVLRTYDQLHARCQTSELQHAKIRILSYSPGAWIQKSSDAKLTDYDIPNTTALILVGPKGSGKSTLLNRIAKVFESGKFTPDRAQVSYMPSNGDGTCFLQEYAIPRNSTSFCLYDTRSLSDSLSDNDLMLKLWLEKGVRHGELVIRNTDDSSLKRRLQSRARHSVHNSSMVRKVNFVIFVVNGVSVLKAMNSEGAATRVQHHNQLVATAFRSPYLSFRDDKPTLVVTHGDLLSLADRVRVRVYLGELLGIPPATQIFDIPEIDDASTDLVITDMLRYSLEHADKNLPHKNKIVKNYAKIQVIVLMCALLLIAMGITFLQKRSHHGRAFTNHASKPDLSINWHEIRHLW